MPIVPLGRPPALKRPRAKPPGRSLKWIRLASALVFLALLAAAWQWTPLKSLVDLPRISAWIEPHRHAWYSLPLVVATYVVMGLFMFPVLMLIPATGIAFGPWLGSAYALAGCLVSASVGFALGRRTGLDRVEHLVGPRVRKLSKTLERNGTLAVFLMRKVPAPYMLANVVVGASPVRYRDFLLGTTLGMSPMIIALAGFGHQLTRIVKEPTVAGIAGAAAYLAVPISLALLINHLLKRRRRDE